MDDLSHDRSGLAYDAARDRVDVERVAGQSLANDVRDLTEILDDGAQRLYWARDAALSKVDVALADECTVLDDCTVAVDAGVSTETLGTDEGAVDATFAWMSEDAGGEQPLTRRNVCGDVA